MNAILRLLMIALIMSGSVQAAEMRNQLVKHPSPYLAMHGDDPTAWQEWNAQTIAKAKKENKLLFVSIGYFACHWCHVMQRESYQNKEIAALLNKNFIPVKVDRELEPALDARLIDFVERTRGYAGWPLNVFITPDGYPLIGVVYLPPQDFKGLLINLSDRWNTTQTELKEVARSTTQELNAQKKTVQQVALLPASALRDGLIKQGMSLADDVQGGFGEDNKFPMSPQLHAMLQIYRDKGSDKLGGFLQLTLDQMKSQGLHDLVRGGFYRYVVDPAWQIPHFEKMLYDNAQLALIYLEAARILQRPEYHAIARSTLDFMIKELSHPQGGLIASLSAVDDKGVEGGFYLWHKDDLKAILSNEQLQIAVAAWGMQHPPTLPDGHLPVVSATASQLAERFGSTTEKIQRQLEEIKAILRQRQTGRVLPQDTKVLAGWNGLALRAYATAAKEYQDARYVQTAQQIKQVILTRLWDGKQLWRARDGAQRIGQASLEDYAYVADGLWSMANHLNDKAALSAVKPILDQAWARFYRTGEGWRLSEETFLQYGGRENLIADGPLPSPSAVIMRVSRDYARRQDDSAMLKMVESAVQNGAQSLAEEPFWFASHIMLVE